MHSHNNVSPHDARIEQDITVVCEIFIKQFTLTGALSIQQ